jgi:hypothetical protein
MKFYVGKMGTSYLAKITTNKLCSIFTHISFEIVNFYKKGKRHNVKNAAVSCKNGNKEFWLNDKIYCYEYNFTKQSWRKFVKLKVFL